MPDRKARLRTAIGRIGLTDITLITVALIMGVLFVRRELNGRVQTTRQAEAVEYVEGWERIAEAGIPMGATNAPIRIIEFADLECPACRVFASKWKDIDAAYSERVALVFVHFPLAQHRFAPVSARALECADKQGKGREFMDRLYAAQDSIGLKTWQSFAGAAGVASPEKLADRVTGSEVFPRIERGTKWGQEIQVRGTPTILVNGWRVAPSTNLREVIDSLLAGRRPFDAHTTRTLPGAH
jgi:hypothetical protein